MGFFSRSAPAPAATPSVPTLGSGRRLRSSLDVPGSVATLERVLATYRTPKYAHLPHTVRIRVEWLAEGAAPSESVWFEDASDSPVVAVYWPTASGSELGLFPLGDGDARLQAIPLPGHLKQVDPSLSSIGLLPGGVVGLHPPQIPDDYVTGTVVAAGFPLTDANVAAAGIKLAELTMVKSVQLVSTKGDRAVDRFTSAHAYGGGSIVAYLQEVVDGLAAVDPGFTPYIQQLPVRMRALFLERAEPEAREWMGLTR